MHSLKSAGWQKDYLFIAHTQQSKSSLKFLINSFQALANPYCQIYMKKALDQVRINGKKPTLLLYKF